MSAGPAGRGRYAGDAAATCGQLLQRYRRLAGVTQEELADRSGYSANYIGKLERDQRDLPAVAADRLAAVLGLADQERAALRAARVRRGEEGLPARLLAGRGPEMAEIRRHLAGLGPPVLMFAGEPGMGKTRLLEEAASGAARSGWGIAQGGCLRRPHDLYAPLAGALTDALQRLPAAARAEALRQAGRLDLLLPELAPAGGGPGLGGPEDGGAHAGAGPERQRRLLFSSAGRCLGAVAGRAGTLLILDDLHWAGPDAFDLLTALVTAAGSPPLRVIGAYRDSETAAGARLGEFVADLARASLVRVLGLEPLSDAEAERLLIGLVPAGQQLPAVLPAIVRRAGGVPFFLVSYAGEVRDGGPGPPHLPVPWTVTQVIRQRVAALPGAAQELLGVAAVAGPVVPHRLLARVTGRTEEEVLQAAETALDARLLAEDEPGGYRFTHDLIRDTVEDGLSAGRRRLLHRRIGETLERDPGAPAESLAFHFGHGDEDGKAITYLERAGDQAQQRVAYAAAADFFAQAAGRLERAGRAAGAVPVTEKQGVALHRAGRYGEAITALDRALEGYRAAGDAEGVHRVTGRLADAHFRRGTRREALGPLAGLAEAGPVQAAGAGSPGAMTRWQGLLRLLYAHGSPQQMAAAGESLARAGRAAGNSRLQAIGTGAEGTGLICQGRLPEGTALLAATMPPDPAAGNDERVAETAALLSGAYLTMGAVDRSQALSARMLRAAESAGDQVVTAMHTLLLGAACYVRGDWPRGQDLIGRAQQRFTATGPSPLAVRIVPMLATPLIWQGAWPEARSSLDTCLQTARSLRIAYTERAALALLAELDVLEGRPQAALNRLHPFITGDLAWITDDQSWNYAVTLLSAAAAAYLELGDLPRARAHAGRAVAEARRTGAWVQGIRALQVEGMTQAGHGHHDLAQATYQEGLRRARAMPFPYGQARLLHACGLLDRQHADHAAAHARFCDALAIFENLGAGKDAGRLREAMAQTSPGKTRPSGAQ